MDVIIIILSFNSRYYIEKCLQSVLKQVKSRVLLIDNASSDGTPALVKNKFKQVDVFANKKNLGYAGGNNVGIEKALSYRPDHVLILNPDAILLDNALKYLLMQAESRVQKCILGPKIYKSDSRLRSNNNFSTLWSAGGELDKKRYTAKLIGYGEKDRGQYEKIRECKFVSGTAMLIPRELLDHGLRFYEPYFMYYEDVEFCLQARKLGFPSYYIPLSKIVHYETSEAKKNHSSLGGGTVPPPRWNDASAPTNGPTSRINYINFGTGASKGEENTRMKIYPKDYYLARNHLLFVERNAPHHVQLREFARLPLTVIEHITRKEKEAMSGVRDYLFRKFMR